jgi:thymidine kinase
VFFIRSQLDGGRFLDYPEDALAFRGGYERCGDHIARIRDSFGLESLVEEWPHVGTWIIDEAAFYDERLAYVVARESRNRGLVFIFPTLVLNFRREIFNPTTRLLLEVCTDVFPLTAYCEHEDCLRDSFYTYRYYTVNERECPALYFDPLIVIGGDREKADDREPNYSTRCDEHHYLPGKEYTFLTLKPLGQAAASGKVDGLRAELSELSERRGKSALERDFAGRYSGASETGSQGVYQNALSVSCLAERALLYLFAEQNLVGEDVFLSLVSEFSLDTDYLRSRLSDAGRSVNAAWANADSHSA